jgi:hypothetical protein
MTVQAYREFLEDLRRWNPDQQGWDPERDRYAFMLQKSDEDGTWEETAVQKHLWAQVIEGTSSRRDLPVAEWKRGCVGQKVLNYTFQVEA